MLATSAAAETIKVATWNIENFTEGSRTVAELSMMAELVDILDADVIALQEVDGPEAAQLIFDPNEYEFQLLIAGQPATHRLRNPARPMFTGNSNFERVGHRRRSSRH